MYSSIEITNIDGKEFYDSPIFGCNGSNFIEAIIFPKEEIKWTFKDIYNLIPEHFYYFLIENLDLPEKINFRFYFPLSELVGNRSGHIGSNYFELDTKQLMTILEEKTEEKRSLFRETE